MHTYGTRVTHDHDQSQKEHTHRDGQQGGLPLTVEQSLQIYDILCQFTGESGAIRQAEFFVYRPSDRAALEAALDRYRSGASIEPTTFYLPVRRKTKNARAVQKFGRRGNIALLSAYRVKIQTKREIEFLHGRGFEFLQAHSETAAKFCGGFISSGA